MPRVILEFEMPNECWDCPVNHASEYREVNSDAWCGYNGEYTPNDGRREDCPLKIADERCRNADWKNDKCSGYQISRWDDEPVDKCRNCEDFELYEGVKE